MTEVVAMTGAMNVHWAHRRPHSCFNGHFPGEPGLAGVY